jgi:hypothetical protein
VDAAAPEVTLQQQHEQWQAHLFAREGAVSGGTFVFGEAIDPAPLWGEGDQVLWAEGEGLMVYGQQGRSKSTLAQQIVNARVGIGAAELLGLPVKRDDRPVFYLAMDRPRQVKRSWRRMVTDDDFEALEERVTVWQGPLPFRLTWTRPGLYPAGRTRSSALD